MPGMLDSLRTHLPRYLPPNVVKFGSSHQARKAVAQKEREARERQERRSSSTAPKLQLQAWPSARHLTTDAVNTGYATLRHLYVDPSPSKLSMIDMGFGTDVCNLIRDEPKVEPKSMGSPLQDMMRLLKAVPKVNRKNHRHARVDENGEDVIW